MLVKWKCEGCSDEESEKCICQVIESFKPLVCLIDGTDDCDWVPCKNEGFERQ